MGKVKKRSEDHFKEDLVHYRSTLSYLGGNIPLECLCLPSRIEKKLLTNGYSRVYDLFSGDFTKIKGIGVLARDIVFERLDDFIAMPL